MHFSISFTKLAIILSLALSASCFVQKSGVVGFSYWQTGHAFEVGNGSRSDLRYVTFAGAFAGYPTVVLSIKSLDSSKSYNLRINTEAIGVSPTGFGLNVYTWADTKIYGVTISWIAYL